MALPKFRVDDNATPAGAGLGYRYVICVEDPGGVMRPIIERRSNNRDQYLAYKQEAIATRMLYDVQHAPDGIPSAQIVDLAAEAEAKVAGGKDEPMPSPTDEQRASREFEVIWETIKSWDVNVPEFYEGYCGATGSHVALILNAMDEAEVRWTKQHVIQALGYLSAELASRSGAWEGKAPDWFPEPPEWLEIFERGLRAAREGRGEGA